MYILSPLLMLLPVMWRGVVIRLDLGLHDSNASAFAKCGGRLRFSLHWASYSRAFAEDRESSHTR